jgi:hypothetical protein
VPEDQVVRARGDHVSVEYSTFGVALAGALVAHPRESEAVEHSRTIVVGLQMKLI